MSSSLAPSSRRELSARHSLHVALAAGLSWLAFVAVVLPPYAGFQVVLPYLSEPDERVGALFGLAYAVVGPVLVVALPTYLLTRHRLLSPLAVTALEVGLFLRQPTGADSIGSPASLMWPVGLALILAFGGVELGLRRVSTGRGRGHS